MSAQKQTKPPNVQDVAQLARTSVATVSRVLNNKNAANYSAATASRVRAAARSLNYEPSELGRQLRTATARAAALLVPDAANAFCADVASSLESCLQSAGLSMLLCNTRESPELQDQYLRQMVNRGISTLVLLGGVESPYLCELSRGDQPIVFVNRRPPPTIVGHYVGIDNHAAGRDVATHFMKRGYTDCAVIHGPHHYAASAERLAGFRNVLAEQGLAIPPERCIESALTSEAGYECGKKILSRDDRPNGIFCGNDLIAYGVYRACREAGLRIPDDIALFGFDDNPLNQWVAPWLSTVHVPVREFGPVIFDRLRPMETKRPDFQSIILPHRLVLRESA